MQDEIGQTRCYQKACCQGAVTAVEDSAVCVGRKGAMALGANRPVRVNQQETDSEVCSPYRIISGWGAG